MRLILVRHGETPSNVEGLLDTAVPGPSLTALGRKQAEGLVGTLEGEPIDAVYASVQQRAQVTAAPLAANRGLGVLVREGLREIGAGEYEMRSDLAAVRAYLENFAAMAAGDAEAGNPDAENGREVFARFDAVIDEIHASGVASAVVVSHGAMIRAWSGLRCTNLDAEFVLRNPLTNTGVVVVEGDPETGWLAETWIGEPIVSPEERSGPAGESAERGF